MTDPDFGETKMAEFDFSPDSLGGSFRQLWLQRINPQTRQRASREVRTALVEYWRSLIC